MFGKVLGILLGELDGSPVAFGGSVCVCVLLIEGLSSIASDWRSLLDICWRRKNWRHKNTNVPKKKTSRRRQGLELGS